MKGFLPLAVVLGVIGLFVYSALPMLANKLPKEDTFGCYVSDEFGVIELHADGIDLNGRLIYERFGVSKGANGQERIVTAAPHLAFAPAGNTLSIRVVKDGQAARQPLQMLDDSGQTRLLIPLSNVSEPHAFTKSACENAQVLPPSQPFAAIARGMNRKDASTTTLPRSDVSAGVGFVGLLGLLAWIIFCRNYGVFAEFAGIPGPREPLSGPYAALAALAASSIPMVLWSVFVDKVHRNPSTGIDWDSPRPVSSNLDVSIVKIAGLWATWAIIGFLYCVARWYWTGQYLFAMEVIAVAAIPMFLLSVPYVLWLDRVMVNPRDHAWHFGAMLLGREAYDPEEVKKHWRAWIIKGFFGAFMISILPGGFAYVVSVDLAGITQDPVRIGRALIELLFVIDVQIGTVGYLVTMRPLDAHIRSGNPFLAGWLAALMCYPPLVFAFMGADGMLAYEVNTAGWAHWFAGSNSMLWLWAAWLAFLTGIYAWATIAFGIRFSNLTYRGVLTNGPYRFTRHPAYLSKNLFWWCATIPFMVTSDSLTDMIRNTFFLGCVSAIYFWRAKTEEAHLLQEDPKYRQYYDWMEQNGLITSRLARLKRSFRPRGPVVAQPAE